MYFAGLGIVMLYHQHDVWWCLSLESGIWSNVDLPFYL